MATDMQLFTLASLLRRGRVLDQLSSALSLVALLIGLAPLLGIAAQPLTALFCALLLACCGALLWIQMRSTASIWTSAGLAVATMLTRSREHTGPTWVKPDHTPDQSSKRPNKRTATAWLGNRPPAASARLGGNGRKDSRRNPCPVKAACKSAQICPCRSSPGKLASMFC